MIVRRIKTEGTAHNSYFLASGHESLIVDPRRDVDVYLELARQNETDIKYVFETHRNEDYAIGSAELARSYSLEIFHGKRDDWQYGVNLKDRQEFRLGHLQIEAIFTPGHTDESVSYVVTDLASGRFPVMVFTGDTLFVDDVGRTDLYGPEEIPRLAGNLYDSLFHKLLPLGDGVIIYPAHGAGSVCGLNISSRDDSTIGIERFQNPVLQKSRREDFIKLKLTEKPERPVYFRRMEKYNLEGPPILGKLPEPPPLSPTAFRQNIEAGATIIDTRLPTAFGGAHIKGSYNIWLEGLSVFAGWVISYDKPIILVLEDPAQIERAVRNLIRSGFDNISGYLRGGIEAWCNAGLTPQDLPQMSVSELKSRLESRDGTLVLDARNDDEWIKGHITGAKHIFVGHLLERLAEIPTDRPVAVFCSVGHRASLGASILLRAGFENIHNVAGGFQAWKAAGFPVVRD